MTFYADLHIHSKYSRACSKDCDLEHLAWWAGRKGVSVVGTGDFTHPAWMAELRENLVPAEPGLFRLRPDLERRVARTLPAACRTPIRFLLSVEISTIYKKGERTRKVHHLIYAPSFVAADRITAALLKIGNLASDGRPILGLDSRHLLEITLASDPGSYLVPAHAWTPWFSVLGSKSGFDAVADCYDDLAGHIFAVETGLSSDPLMNWRVPSLDQYRLVSNSDAHSPPALAREASAFSSEIDYFAMRTALATGDGFAGSVEFFPEEGKYHLDGHRKCGVRFEPGETKEHDGRCPACGRPLTVGVLSRVDELAAHPEGRRPEGAVDFRNLIPLPEIVGELRGVGPRTKSVLGHVAELVATLGPELSILTEVPLDDLRAADGELLTEAIARLRQGNVIRDAGYDGEYGEIHLFHPTELRRQGKTAIALQGTPNDTALFDLPTPPNQTNTPHPPHTNSTPKPPPLPGSAPPTVSTTSPPEAAAAASTPATSHSARESTAANTSTTPHPSDATAAGNASAPPRMGGVPDTNTAPYTGGVPAAANPPAPPRTSGGSEAADTSGGSAAGNASAPPCMGRVLDTTAAPRTSGVPAAADVSALPRTGGGSDAADVSAAARGGGGSVGVVFPIGPAQADSPERAVVAAPVSGGVVVLEGQGDLLAVAEGSVLDGLDPEQRAAAGHPGGPLLIVAGPGTGKTRTLTRRIAHVVAERGVAPERCLAITFTRRAAEELRERLDALLPGRAERLTVATFHSLGALILREQHDRAGLSAQFRIADESDRLDIARELTGSDQEARKLLKTLDRTPTMREPATPEQRATFVRLLRERDLADFTDLIREPVRVLSEDAELAARYRERWPWISVDEYQDVDATQYALLRLLTGPDSNLTAIGDPDQAIYSFRGADVGFFLAFEGDYPAATSVRLGRNYRSAPAIVMGAVRAVAPSSLVPGRALEPQRDGDELITVHEAADAEGEAGYVAATIDRLLGGSSFHSMDSGRSDGNQAGHFDFSEIAVLYRTDAQSMRIMEAFTRSGVPYQKRSHDRLVKHPGVLPIAHELRYHGGPVHDRVRAAADKLIGVHDETDLRTAAELLAPLAVRHGEDVEGFLGDLALGAEVDTYDPRADRVALLTLHAAKGLEFPIVFVIGCEDGLLPLRLPDTSEAEERRLFFVGMTRAQTHLFLSGTRRREPSPFLKALPDDLVAAPEKRKRARDRQLRLL